ncbi:hypothetical protein [Phaffia rhodozyma]|uniref:Uncharacterized protein n=1 Tax=Phaffia rhodozyma TaxID=264483 RepID=A0A0F7SF72_PHARH|nr:hypothetical protein [Phaffia rhodozyma]
MSLFCAVFFYPSLSLVYSIFVLPPFVVPIIDISSWTNRYLAFFDLSSSKYPHNRIPPPLSFLTYMLNLCITTFSTPFFNDQPITHRLPPMD